MSSSALRALWHLAVFVILISLLATGWSLAGRWLASGSASNDPPAINARLAEFAADIGPTIAVIERFRQDTKAYPATAAALARRLPQGIIADTAGDTVNIDTGHGVVWSYLRADDGQGYELTRHLPDSGSLTATNDHGRITWLYAETDDDDPEPVALPSPSN